MMDELELLKKDWQKKKEHLPKLSYDEIHKMTWKKSSSVVKWILIISILELILPNLLVFLSVGTEDWSTQNLGLMGNYYIGFNIFYYIVVLYFIFQFYNRYKEISVLDNSKNLMRKIIKTRKTVKHYVIFCLAMILVFFAIFIVGIYVDDSVLLSIEGVSEKAQEIPLEKLKSAAVLILALGGIAFAVVMGGVYFLLYGLLLRKLKFNYKELKRLEV
ncbi:hypothetical protein FGM00_04075 [Aggregatimonas sangjinii]|uniref:Uncharacterized protein n=1 Tax=Aggregatimonas sangjinii TaxID=2583587 RepID=A0A5B7SQT6_9FLAO|nr:hypothetical protein [Aggregatimonas sangjinii]QCW99327.1 hypothetical protein FGM00_04075 [Aggregatimonas sangjinii]